MELFSGKHSLQFTKITKSAMDISTLNFAASVVGKQGELRAYRGEFDISNFTNEKRNNNARNFFYINL